MVSEPWLGLVGSGSEILVWIWLMMWVTHTWEGDCWVIKCEWLCLTSTRNGGNKWYIRQGTHKPNALRFWVRVWCLSLLWSWMFGPLPLPGLLGPPQQQQFNKPDDRT